MKTIMNFSIAVFLLLPVFIGCSSDDSEDIIDQDDPQSDVVDTLV